ncbi:MAG: type 4a pilus biogenesis protein PilO [Helicobacteraceae bacterium]|nr:type 4a pilus biogenesis protein PilO [Candidatus Sulfurimonas ponti]MBL6973108.1 type 4a pilus biogenesis protein PilO [Sulfurimonas sp.]
MKINIEDFLQNIDNYFKDKTKKDVYMTYFMIFAIIFAFSYLLFWDTSEADFNAKRTQVVSIESKIAMDNLYLQKNPISKIAQIENEIKNAQIETLKYKDNNQYIKNKIEEISSLIYDEQTWGEYLHSISKNARLYNVKILNLHNQYAENKTTFGHILDINLKVTGDYKNTINFINSLEKSDLVVDLHDINIEALNKLHSDLNISVWGITY